MSHKERSIAPANASWFTSTTVNQKKDDVTVQVNVVPGGFPVLLFLVFLILKLTEEVSWSWWWITSPLWVVVVGALLTAIVSALVKKSVDTENIDS